MSNIHVSQLNAGMDLGPAHKNIALNHLVARSMGRVMAEDDINPERPSFSPGGDEDDNPSAWYRARKAERRAITPVPTPEPTPEPITPVHRSETPVPESPIVEEPGARRRRMNPLWVVGTDGIKRARLDLHESISSVAPLIAAPLIGRTKPGSQKHRNRPADQASSRNRPLPDWAYSIGKLLIIVDANHGNCRCHMHSMNYSFSGGFHMALESRFQLKRLLNAAV